MPATALASQHELPAVSGDDEKRRAHRRIENTAGKIKVRGYRMAIPCSMRNTSATGACVMLHSGRSLEVASHLPDSIVLVFEREFVEIDCKIVWRDGNRFGVQFTSSFRRTD